MTVAELVEWLNKFETQSDVYVLSEHGRVLELLDIHTVRDGERGVVIETE